ncbi:hypothetical protein GW17_00053054, partial [Ensete ventricosum]
PYADRPLPGGTVGWGCFRPDFDHRCSLSGGIDRGRRKKREKKRKNLESDVVLWRHLDLLPPSLVASLTHVASTTLATFHPRGGKKPQRRYWYVDRPLPGGTAKN